MPPSPERGQFIHQMLDWMGSTEVTDKINSYAAQTYIEGIGNV